MIHAKTDLHELRLDVAVEVLIASGARTVLDLGCGAGALLRRLVRVPQFEKILGVDKCGISLLQAQDALREHPEYRPDRVSVTVGSYTDRDPGLIGFDACAMVETIEHIEPAMLARAEQAIFGCYRPRTLVMTTPNAEFNVLFGLGRNEFRKDDHCFEWDRAKFRSWASGVAHRHGYQIRFSGIGQSDLLRGEPTQMAVFTRNRGAKDRASGNA